MQSSHFIFNQADGYIIHVFSWNALLKTLSSTLSSQVTQHTSNINDPGDDLKAEEESQNSDIDIVEDEDDDVLTEQDATKTGNFASVLGYFSLYSSNDL